MLNKPCHAFIHSILYILFSNTCDGHCQVVVVHLQPLYIRSSSIDIPYQIFELFQPLRSHIRSFRTLGHTRGQRMLFARPKMKIVGLRLGQSVTPNSLLIPPTIPSPINYSPTQTLQALPTLFFSLQSYFMWTQLWGWGLVTSPPADMQKHSSSISALTEICKS